MFFREWNSQLLSREDENDCTCPECNGLLVVGDITYTNVGKNIVSWDGRPIEEVTVYELKCLRCNKEYLTKDSVKGLPTVEDVAKTLHSIRNPIIREILIGLTFGRKSPE